MTHFFILSLSGQIQQMIKIVVVSLSFFFFFHKDRV